MRRILAVILALAALCPSHVRGQERRYVALTFDDGPSGRFTRRLLEGLEQRQAKATFLLCGYRIREYPGIAQQIIAGGHEIGLHGYSHQDMGKMSYAQAYREILDTLALLPKECQPVFLRPPGGSCCDASARAAADLGLALLDWSVDPRDWCCDDATAVANSVLSRVQDGDVILLHDMTESSVAAAFLIIDRLQGQGYEFVTVSQLAAIKNVFPQPGVTYRHFREDVQ